MKVKAFSSGYQVLYLNWENHYYFVVVKTLCQMEIVRNDKNLVQ